MRIDVVTIFPDYLAPLDLSLVGKARRDGLLDVRVHDLRDWTSDRHRTVDDTPFGGGAGMVMRPDVWGRALDDVLAASPRPVLLVPTPAGELFTQALADELATAEHLVFACGRYEGIDARVAERYADGRSRPDGVVVRQVSIGDYVLNGGEVAALVIIEAVARLLPGVIGNPASLVEESHGAAGLLEYPVYTKPLLWAGREVPDVLLSGHHGRIARWRRDEALARTARIRPDLIAALDPARLEATDLAVLRPFGWLRTGDGALRHITVRAGTPDDAADLAVLAAATFGLACPPGTSGEDIAHFIAANLSVERCAAHAADRERYALLVAQDDGAPGHLVGYTLCVLPRSADEPPYAEEVAALVTARPVAELSKCYALAEYHGTGLASLLLAAAQADLESRTVGGERYAAVWLGTNLLNRRAQRFYVREGFALLGRRSFRVGGEVHEDVVMVRPLSPSGAPSGV